MDGMDEISAAAWGDRLSQHGSRRLPVSGQWEITCRCNLRCVMCYTDCFNTPEKLREELTLPEIVRILDEIQEAGCLELTLTGGEPLARRDFLEIYVAAKRRGFLATIFTNGTLITPLILEVWQQYPPFMIEISLHGFSERSFDSITQGQGSYDRCTDAIRSILEHKLPLTLKTVGMTVNRDQIQAIKGWIEELRRRYGTRIGYKFGSDIRPRLDGTEDVFQYQLDQDDVSDIEHADPEFWAERLEQDQVKADVLRRGKPPCAGGREKFHIDAYGQLQLCSNNRLEGYDLRRGSFSDGFYHVLPQFPCPARQPSATSELLQIGMRR